MALRHRLSSFSRREGTRSPDRTVLHRRYALERRLAEDKAVFLAWDSKQSCWVIIKQASSTYATERLSHEASLLGNLNHPSIPHLVEAFGAQDGTYTLVEEWKPGTPMGQQQQRLKLAEVVWVGQHLAEVLHYLHTNGLIHRDIKPDNILIDPGKAVFLIDFDISASITDPWCKQWTRGYSAPEQCSQGVIHPQADIYSLGMLLGSSLIACEPEEALQVRSFSGLCDDPQKIPKGIWPLLEVLDRTISPHPDERPTLPEMWRALNQVTIS